MNRELDDTNTKNTCTKTSQFISADGEKCQYTRKTPKTVIRKFLLLTTLYKVYDYDKQNTLSQIGCHFVFIWILGQNNPISLKTIKIEFGLLLLIVFVQLFCRFVFLLCVLIYKVRIRNSQSMNDSPCFYSSSRRLCQPLTNRLLSVLSRIF